MATTVPSNQPVTDPVLDQVERLLDAHRYDEAHDILKPWMKANSNAPDRDRAVFLLAETYYQKGSRDRFKAFYFLDELMDKYPASRFYGLAMQKQYQIADDYLNGYKNSFLYLRVLSAEDEAIEMLYRIQERRPARHWRSDRCCERRIIIFAPRNSIWRKTFTRRTCGVIREVPRFPM